MNWNGVTRFDDLPLKITFRIHKVQQRRFKGVMDNFKNTRQNSSEFCIPKNYNYIEKNMA